MHAYLCFLLFISTDDASRVILSVPDSDGSDYINASFINVRRHAFNFFNIPASEVQSTRVCLTYNITIDILSCLHVTNCFSRCFNLPPFTFRATVRDLPTLLHKVNNTA